LVVSDIPETVQPLDLLSDFAATTGRGRYSHRDALRTRPDSQDVAELRAQNEELRMQFAPRADATRYTTTDVVTGFAVESNSNTNSAERQLCSI
jgi:hypothetical protein